MINSTSKTGSALPPDYVAKKPASDLNSGSRQSTTDSLSSSSMETLQSVLQNQPEVRPEVVDRGRQLAAGNYPPMAIIQKLSELMVNSSDLAN